MQPIACYYDEGVQAEYESQHKRAVTMQAGSSCMYGLGLSDVNFMLTNQV